ncbi:hypothetical protein HCBAA847_0950 [Helicobacter cinaedi CCUG 18818 = ATCC BAA-847]|uniref:Uncharacterized protein n=1 Tax=Helicobacter cinaedi CCUG 18818 = ATCC BAA-847 TaxID=537971 RepID=A0AAI8QGZ1_9HELI|nr:hypothetical protein [Helicobacter cinaedi]BAM32188.1 hypothetical protein HCBAA847_0950 [Helicobacter cinaedi CCUG 18818 = ATCC BAA-847]
MELVLFVLMFIMPLGFVCVVYGVLHFGFVGVMYLIHLFYKKTQNQQRALLMLRILALFAWVIYLALPLWAGLMLGLETYEFGVYKQLTDKDRGVYILDIYTLCCLYICAIWFLRKILAKLHCAKAALI